MVPAYSKIHKCLDATGHAHGLGSLRSVVRRSAMAAMIQSAAQHFNESGGKVLAGSFSMIGTPPKPLLLDPNVLSAQLLVSLTVS